ncbi:MAG: hypothetical protein A3G45_01525 [Candidatus Staskawiczbacteria bacterium RIFCSPLOWO2_12_FULL_37_15]|uniref:Uncharacterized protein n=1 Tax=Candidatus Staskawiczbacteria bacterium RIFCSPLOWO2_12_FULL_37_15 TaxID=1802218 RepID=A0A1G2IKB3_9BACT|nr:MAG: hypothetical protein A3G45_01525 [Candidatus Staskawiczbacteria bacterium RIFCSPLOWO2_12_FULL_37_15]
MDFQIKNIKENILSVARLIGYVMLEAKSPNEYNMVRKLTGEHYPRFHIYVKKLGDNLYFNLHLDQKAPIYQSKGVHAHSGEYFGPVVEQEAHRIKGILEKI